MVLWIIGLSGAGKTTLAKAVVQTALKFKNNVVLIDGDMIRDVFGNDIGHTLEDRRRNADRICRFCKFLDDQGIHVVCSILSIFPESRSWNRENTENYFEVYVKCPIQQLQERDGKGLYRRFKNGEIKDVAGMDLEFIEPENSNLVIHNSGSLDNLLSHTNHLATLIENSVP